MTQSLPSRHLAPGESAGEGVHTNFFVF